MANTVQRKRGTTAQVNGYTGPSGEFVYNTSTKRIHTQDGSTSGGAPLALLSDLDNRALTSTTVSAGSGLTGGGSLAANRTLSLNSTTLASLAKANSSVQTVNGNGPDGAGNVVVDASFAQDQDSRASATSATFPPAAQWVRTSGYYAAGDGGEALYKRVATQPSHAGKFQSADGAWWELSSAEVNPLMFGAKGDGISDDTAAFKNALDYMRNPDASGLPGGLPRRNFRRRFDLMGKLYAVTETMDIDMCFGIHITNGTLIAIGTWSGPTVPLLAASDASLNNFDNFSISNVTLQCNHKCSGLHLRHSSLYQLNNMTILGWGISGYGVHLDAASGGWSASATIHGLIVLPYVSWMGETPISGLNGTGMRIGHNDIIVTGCEIAAGYRAIEFKTGTAAVQFNDNHTWIANPGNNPGIEINGNFGIILNGNYFDSHPVWVKGAGYSDISITNNFFLGGSPSPTAAVVLESPAANYVLKGIVIMGNTGVTGMLRVVERYSPAGTGFAGTLEGVIVRNNPISTTATGNRIKQTATEGAVASFISPANLDASFRTRIKVDDEILLPSVPNDWVKCSFGFTQNDAAMTDTFVTGYFYNVLNGYLYVKLNRAATGYLSVSFKIDLNGGLIPAVLP